MNIKKSVKTIITIIIFIVIALIIVYFVKSPKYKKTDETAELKDKIIQEIYFLDDYLISMANSVNNINLENYIIKAETITGQSNKENNNSNSTGESKEEGESSKNSSSNNSSEEKSKANSYVLEPSDILVNERNPDWESLKIATERLYSTWPTIVIDLYKLNINNETVEKFSKDLDNLTNSIKIEDKSSTLMYISKLYDYLPIFGASVFNNSLNNNIIATKSNILNAYKLIEKQNWNEMKSYINKAEDEYINVINNQNNKNQYNINKAYIILKEFEKSIDNQNMDILYIKYKNLLDELNMISI